jgi:3'-5' exoribonuclease
MNSGDSTAVVISALRPGQQVDGVFACSRKDRLFTRTGSPYLALELRDRTGVIQARAFQQADSLAGRFERGDLVRVAGRVERFRDEPVVEVVDIARVSDGVDPGQFLPSAYRDLDELDGFLEHLAREVVDRRFREFLDGLMADGSLRADLRRAPCTRAGHHAYLGGLLEHTVAVATLVQETCILHPRLDSDLLMAAAILHDVGKTREFRLGAEIELSEEGRLLGHVELGLRMLRDAPLALQHCVAAHHGPDALPGRRFGSAEALALYRLNSLDASVKGALEHGLPA